MVTNSLRRVAWCIGFGQVDQTTYMRSSVDAPSVRHPCMPSDGWAGIHIMNEEAQLARVQTLLNAIWRAETRTSQPADLK